MAKMYLYLTESTFYDLTSNYNYYFAVEREEHNSYF